MADAALRSLAHTVMLGRDGHLFERQDHTIEQLTGAMTLPDSQVARWAALIAARHAWCRARGISYYVVITPEKHVVYADKLPAGIVISSRRPFARIWAGLPSALRQAVIYPVDILRDFRDREATYYQADTHWTNYGAYLAYLRILEAIQRDRGIQQMPVTALERSSYRKLGDLGMRMTPEQFETATRVTPAGRDRIKRVFTNNTYGLGQVDVFETPDQSAPKAVMFRDSSGSYVIPFLANNFARLVALATDRFFYDLVEAERPDVVISQTTERGLGKAKPGNPAELCFPEDDADIAFADFSKQKLPLPTNRLDFVDIDFAERTEPVWSVGPRTEMILTCRVPYAPCVLKLTASPFLHPPTIGAQRVTVAINSRPAGTFVVTQDRQTIECSIPLPHLVSSRTLRLELFHPDRASPRSVGAGDDEREISLLFHRLILRPQD